MYFKQKFEPEGEKILHGAGQSLEAFTNYWNAVGENKPIIYMTYVRINKIKEWSNKIKKEIRTFPNLIIQVGLNLKVKDEGSKCSEITKGCFDEEINFLCRTIKELKNPVFIRIGYEFNSPDTYLPDNFISAWRYIINKLKENDVENFASVWCACTAFNKNIKDIMRFYPGDDYVDWFGNDLFGIRHFKDSKDKVTEDFCKEAEKHQKPLMIGECSAARIGALDGEKSWNDWFRPFFDWIHKHPIVKAFCYINWHWGIDWKQPEWGDCRIQVNETVRKKYVEELNKKCYIHNKEFQNFTQKQ